jgi:hypothetical protein
MLLFYDLQQMAAATVDKIVLEKFGSKSMRIFRYIRWVCCHCQYFNALLWIRIDFSAEPGSAF